ncbi:MAG: PEP-CTERM sorting domain-containing protein [Thiotrichaceae bacterium]|nr:PEP-CTERM sorting domain-containing protein [Thiotrichaceae bacterium]
MLLVISISQSVYAGVVLFQQGTVFPDSTWNNFYNSQPGVSSSIISSSSTITSASLASVDLFIAATPVNTYSTAEASALSTFLTGGGNMLLLGEHSGFPTENGYVNSLLSAMGSGMSLAGGAYDCGPQIANASQTVGSLTVAGMSYGCSSTLINGGITGLLAKDLSTILMASEIFGAGRLTLMGDGNLGHLANTYDEQFFMNLLEDVVPVPAPAPLALMCLGLAAIGYARRRKLN